MLTSLTESSQLALVLIALRISLLLAVAWALHFMLRNRNPRWQILMWRTAAVSLLAIACSGMFLRGWGVQPLGINEWNNRQVTINAFVQPNDQPPNKSNVSKGVELLESASPMDSLPPVSSHSGLPANMEIQDKSDAGWPFMAENRRG